MTIYELNPFWYGKPVPPNRFVGRERALRTIFARIFNHESTAVVGEPHIGKTSVLRYIADDAMRAKWLGVKIGQYIVFKIDCHAIPTSYYPADIWREVLSKIEETFHNKKTLLQLEEASHKEEILQLEKILLQLEVVRQSQYGSFTLNRLFELLDNQNQCVLLLIDEFDILLHHANFNTAEFFGALRSFSTLTEGLVLVIASRMSVTEMNSRSQEINPLGSPLFNAYIDVPLPPLRADQVAQLIDVTLEGTKVSFSAEDRAYLVRQTGRHPYLVQMASAALFDVIMSSRSRQERYIEAIKIFQHSASDHFENLWYHLSANRRRALCILATIELPQPDGPVGDLEQYDLALRWLKNSELIESDSEGIGGRWDSEYWRISAASFAHWIVDQHKWEDIDESPGTWLPEEHERQELIAFLKKKVFEQRRRLQILILQRERQGPNNVDPAIITEIEDLQDTIAKDELEMRKLGGRI